MVGVVNVAQPRGDPADRNGGEQAKAEQAADAASHGIAAYDDREQCPKQIVRAPTMKNAGESGPVTDRRAPWLQKLRSHMSPSP